MAEGERGEAMTFAIVLFGYGIAEIAIAIVIIAAVVALVFVALRNFGVSIPAWVVSCFWIVVVCLVVIFCIKLVAGMW